MTVHRNDCFRRFRIIYIWYNLVRKTEFTFKFLYKSLVPADVSVGAKLSTRASDFTSLAVSIQGKFGWNVNLMGFLEDILQPNRSAISTLVWRDWRKPQRISVNNIADALVEMLRIKFRLVSLKVDCYVYFKCLYHIGLSLITFYVQTTNKPNELQNTQLEILCSALWSTFQSAFFLGWNTQLTMQKRKSVYFYLNLPLKTPKCWNSGVVLSPYIISL